MSIHKLILFAALSFAVLRTDAQTKIIAHRGFSSIAPENTLSAFQKAIACKADYFELDVHHTKDDSLVVIHDASVDKTSSNNTTGKIADLTYSDLSNMSVGYSKKFGDQYADEKIPTLREALTLAKGKIKVCIEIKVLGIEEEVLAIVNALDMNEEVIIFAFDYPVLAKIRQLDKNIPILYLKSAADELTIEYAKVIDAQAIGVGSRTEITQAFLDVAHKNDIEVWRWTVNKEEDMQKLMDVGIDGLITNYPDKALTIRTQSTLLGALQSPIIFKGDETKAYRDPAVLYHEDVFYLFFTLVTSEEGKIYSYTAMSHSTDLKNWSPEKILTPQDQSLNFCSPGNVIRYQDEWILCLQTYPRPGYTTDQKTRYGTADARVYLMRSKDLETWSAPELMKVKGPDVATADMGRMIDPYLLEDKDEQGKWWCFYKQNGVSMSYSYDLRNWTFVGHTESGENVCVLNENDEYILFHSPRNGIGMKRSSDLSRWKDWGNLITLGQEDWDWAKGRISAGTVINLKGNKAFGKYLMFFHGSGPKTEVEGDFDKNASIGIAWSDDLLNWSWPDHTK